MVHKQKKSELMICGLNACLGIFLDHPSLIIRAYYSPQTQGKIGTMLSWLAKEKKAYHSVNESELEKITKSTHHEGVALLIQKPKGMALSELLSLKKTGIIIFLEGVENPHNLGAILRSAAHFGVKGVIIQKSSSLYSSALFRVAEGGALKVPIVEVEGHDWLDSDLLKSYQVFSTTSHGQGNLYQVKFKNNVLVIIGSENSGVSQKLLSKSFQRLTIPGTGWVESLNVNQATTLIMSEWFRQSREV